MLKKVYQFLLSKAMQQNKSMSKLQKNSYQNFDAQCNGEKS